MKKSGKGRDDGRVRCMKAAAAAAEARTSVICISNSTTLGAIF